MSLRPRRVRVGDPITEGWMNEVVDLANRARLTVSQGSGLSLLEGPDGYVLSLSLSRPIWAKITGPISSGTYPWVQVYPETSGTWSIGTTTGVAYESNGNPSVPLNSYVELDWTSAGDYRFTLGAC